ncbi:MAG: hypothetical protein MZV70_13515 [Desulfobacterales bacterium]|nr:hypothetical protein [Desulfobacterales bacterium]
MTDSSTYPTFPLDEAYKAPVGNPQEGPEGRGGDPQSRLPSGERMALGIKQLLPDPWRQRTFLATFKLGEEFGGKVPKMTDFGVFVEMENGVAGLVYLFGDRSRKRG